ncbi:MAG TPA: peptidase C39 family protein [Candidatus Acidoferrales bacterium]|nr:peptidase C39 family protein [Candidatus Acidoferrales bacterium]
MPLNVPYYSQSAEFSCGPACVVMVMKHFEPKLKMDRRLEFEVWRQCNMIGTRGADPYGLSVPLLDAGYKVRLITQRRVTVDYEWWKQRLKNRFTAEDVELSFFGMKENQHRTRARGLPVTYKRPTVADVVRGVQEGYVPVALVHMGVIHSLNIPHWVVVTDADEETVIFNDPYPPKGRKGLKLNHVKFQKILDDIGTRIGMTPSILLIGEKS